jgi:1-aminocyclopropane-1-carboxylate deaminase/D-cysteine desulfhydrase-like pyridoxal-dependent ACC family enzyme
MESRLKPLLQSCLQVAEKAGKKGGYGNGAGRATLLRIAMTAYPLLQAHPKLAAALPVAGLLAGPTPVEPMVGTAGIFIKRDDLTATDYGGNKVRKLDLLLAGAHARGARDLVVFGYAGSNFVAATAWHGRKLGLRTIGYLLPQRPADYVADNLAVDLAAGAELHVHGGRGRVVASAMLRSAQLVLRTGRSPDWIPPGGSSPLGTIGFVNAAFELREQVKAGALPEPDTIYTAFSSMGTVAGLALGLGLAGLKTRIQAIQVVGTEFASWAKLERLIGQTERLLKRLDPSLRPGPALDRVQIRSEFLGAGYALPTGETQPAMARFAAAGGSRADPCYSGKALAGLYHDLDVGRLAGKTTLFWHTLSARALPPGVTRPEWAAVPAALRGYFEARSASGG